MKTVKKTNAPTTSVAADIFKSYDIRGTVPDQLNPEVARLIGRAFATEVKGERFAVGRDMRIHSDILAEALIGGLMDSGCNVVDVGRVSTDALYFAVGHLGTDGGVMITASHNPPEYNGFKLCRSMAEPLSGTDGIERMRMAIEMDDYILERGTGTCSASDILPQFVEHVLSFIDTTRMKPFKVVVDAGNGMAGAVLPAVFNRLPCILIPMYFEPDGTFPNHLANPIEPDNIADLQKRVLAEKADLGVAFDGDADRMFLIDETGKPLGGDMVMLLVAKNLLEKNPGAAILYNLICSKAVPEMIERMGGRAIRTPVGHAIIKPLMKREGAVFGGEHSGHFYFQKNWYADSGLIAMLMAMEVLALAEQPLSSLVASVDPYFRSGELNTKVKNITKTLDKIIEAFPGALPDHTDGITLVFDEWWFNVRPSNTEPLLRLNVEANSADLLEEKTADLLAVIRGRRKAAVKPKRQSAGRRKGRGESSE